MKDTKLCMEAVVKLHCVHTPSNYSQPWNKAKSYSSTGSAFAISGRRLLTNAHCVDHYTQIKVQRLGSDTKYLATVLAIGYECDIALLSVEDDSFWHGMEAVEFGELPHLQDEVTVVGYPVGGNTISVTSGVVSRIDIATYSYADPVELLRVQIDAAINAGNSGGPAFNSKHECIGIAFESLTGADTDSIGYIIPTPVIQHFLEDFSRNGKYTGFPWLGCLVQNMESPHLRAASGMQPHHKGLLIKEVLPCAPIVKLVKAGDVLLRFDGVDIANDGTIPFRRGQRIKSAHLVSKKFVHDTATITVLQSGIEQTYTMQLTAPTYPVPAHTRASPPPYLIIGGLVFTALSLPYLISEYGSTYEEVAPVGLLHEVHNSSKRPCGDQLVVLSQVLAAPITVGYESFANLLVARLNGQPVRNMQDLARILDSTTHPFLEFDLQGSTKLVLPTQAAREATPGILETHCIPTDRSASLRPAALAVCRTCPCCQGGGWDLHHPGIATPTTTTSTVNTTNHTTPATTSSNGTGAEAADASTGAPTTTDATAGVAAACAACALPQAESSAGASTQCIKSRGVLDGVPLLECAAESLALAGVRDATGPHGAAGVGVGGDGNVAQPVTPPASEVEFDGRGGEGVVVAAEVEAAGMRGSAGGDTLGVIAAAAAVAAGSTPDAGGALGEAPVEVPACGMGGCGMEAGGDTAYGGCGGVRGWGGPGSGHVVAVMAGLGGGAAGGGSGGALAVVAGSCCTVRATSSAQQMCSEQHACTCSAAAVQKAAGAVKLPMKRKLD